MMENKTVIFCDNLDDGNKLLDNMLSEIKFKNFEYFTKGYSGTRARLKNGDEYLVLRANDSARGHRFHKAYVHTSVSDYFVNTVIKPFFRDEIDIVYFR